MEQQPLHKKAVNLISDTLQTFLIALSVFLVVYFFIARPFQVSGESMYPTYKDKEYIFTNILGLKLGHLNRGDVVVFKAPVDKSKDFIKRVVGLPGDTVGLSDGYVMLNDQRLDESDYLNENVKTYGGTFMKQNETITVPKDSVFVMGDNRPYSSDGREWGFLKQEDIIGKSFFVYWPVTEAHLVINPFNK